MRAISILALAALLACETDLPKQSEVQGLRVLGVQAEPAELILDPSQPPPNARLTALAVDTNGEAIQLDWSACLIPSPTLPTADLDCPGASGIDLPVDAQGGALVDLASAELQPLRPLLSEGTLSIGFVASAGQQALPGFASIPVRGPGEPVNHNPSLKAVQLGGAALTDSSTIRAGAKLPLLPIPADDAKEQTASGPEALNFSFFATRGELSAFRSADTTATGTPGVSSVDYTAPAGPGPVRLWVVVRDGRGGVGFFTSNLEVIP